jgi:SAM-dependent methyltransferase
LIDTEVVRKRHFPRSPDILQSHERQSHAVLDLHSRRLKAIKIEHLLSLCQKKQPLRLLEVGTGSGGIAHYFGEHPTLDCEVFAVDVLDQRLIKDGFKFALVGDTTLPFKSRSFDIVLSNHVIEHVGDHHAQRHHLIEIHRVLSLDGTCYLATPNRWMVFEPHYNLIFLSWLPDSMRSNYLRLCRKGNNYDCRPFTKKELEGLLKETHFNYENLCTKALRETVKIEPNVSTTASFVSRMPDLILNRLTIVNPTLIYKISKF